VARPPSGTKAGRMCGTGDERRAGVARPGRSWRRELGSWRRPRAALLPRIGPERCLSERKVERDFHEPGRERGGTGCRECKRERGRACPAADGRRAWIRGKADYRVFGGYSEDGSDGSGAEDRPEEPGPDPGGAERPPCSSDQGSCPAGPRQGGGLDLSIGRGREHIEQAPGNPGLVC
jgi:hypothetical protein